VVSARIAIANASIDIMNYVVYYGQYGASRVTVVDNTQKMYSRIKCRPLGPVSLLSKMQLSLSYTL